MKDSVYDRQEDEARSAAFVPPKRVRTEPGPVERRAWSVMLFVVVAWVVALVLLAVTVLALRAIGIA